MKIYAPLLFIALAAPLCAAVPNKITYQGRLSQNGIPSSGSKTFVACFKAGLTTVTPCESQVLTLPPSGDFTLVLTPPSSIDWLGSAVKLEISVDGVLLSPADDLSSVPYALTAGTAAALSGSAAASQVRLNAASTLDSWQSPSDASLIDASKIDGSIAGQWTEGGGALTYTGGNVGIGTSTPSVKLDVKGALQVGAGARGAVLTSSGDDNFQLKTYGSTPNPNFFIGAGNGAGGLAWRWIYGEGTGRNIFLAPDGGNVGVGTLTPSNKLEVTGGWMKVNGTTGPGGDTATRIGVHDTDNTGGVTGWWLSQNNDGKFAVHQNASSDRIVVDGTGNVGIGTSSPAAKMEVAGDLIRTIPRAHGLGPNDETDAGRIVSRTLTMTKKRADTGLRITYTDNLRLADEAAQGTSCRWELRFNGSSCTNPGPLVFDHYNNYTNLHGAKTLVSTCFGLPAGNHEVQVWVGAVPPYANGDCYTGWFNSYWSIEAEEVR